jgi:multiple sugar transport system permease protein
MRRSAAGGQAASLPLDGRRSIGRSVRVTTRRISLRLVVYALLAVIVFINDFPMVWMALTALKRDAEIVTYPPSFLPIAPTFENFTRLFTIVPYGHYLLDSFVVATVSTIAVVSIGTVGAYSLVRFDFRLVRWVGEASLVAYMLPAILLLVPLSTIMYALHLDNNLLSLMLIYSTLLLPLGLWTLRSYFQGIARELEEAAMVDGCTRFGAFRRVVLPEAIPGMIACAIFTFNASWGEFLFASTLMTHPDVLTLSPGLLLMTNSSGVQTWGLLMAGSVVMILPLLVLFTFGQRYLVESWSEGAVRG